uniref:Uncharacterized protein n=1 Tax=Anopheles minimus TaxID=112268 RepID=A0A182WPP5_9DIPT
MTAAFGWTFRTSFCFRDNDLRCMSKSFTHRLGEVPQGISFCFSKE